MTAKIRKTDFAQAGRFNRQEYHYSGFSERRLLNGIKQGLMALSRVFFWKPIVAGNPFLNCRNFNPQIYD